MEYVPGPLATERPSDGARQESPQLARRSRVRVAGDGGCVDGLDSRMAGGARSHGRWGSEPRKHATDVSDTESGRLDS